MNKLLKNSNGSALLIAVAVLLIFSILGLSLMRITASGITKNQNRESIVQATDLADKGIDFAISNLQKTLEDYITNNQVGKSEFSNFLNNTLKNPQLACSLSGNTGFLIPTDNNSTTKICIENIITPSLAEKDLYKRIVTFKSTGIVNGKEQITRSDVILGTDAIPDQLRYTLSSNNEGSIYLYGGVDIKGDIKTSKDLIIHNQGYTLSGTSTNWRSSVYPRMKADSKSVTPKIILPESGSVFVNKNTNHLGSESSVLNLNVYNNLSRYDRYSVEGLLTNNKLRTILFDSNNVNIVKKSLVSDELKIKEKIETTYSLKSYKNSTVNSIDVSSSSHRNRVFNSKDDVILVSAIKQQRGECIKYGWYGCSDYKYYTVLEKGFLNIDGMSNLNLVGQYYINGDLSIKNSSLNSDAILYVDGDVAINDSVLSGYGSNGTLIIFATGKIKIINTSPYLETPSRIKGFFYSQSTVNIFGAISNIEIIGGISGKNIVLSALRGKYTRGDSIDTVSAQSELYNHDNNPSTPDIPRKKSRFTIIYDQDLIEAYTSFKRDEEEEFITEINPPEIVNRK
ncbi:MAG: hypothetical protein ABS939_13860 [Psychrobacillus sp.]